ncbi:MAG: 3-dehydroquinate synthase, partial [Opitutaceae bacterium]
MALELQVNLGERSYPIAFAGEVVGAVKAVVAKLMAEGRRVAVLTDNNVRRAQDGALRQMFGAAPVHVVPAGETAKSLTEFGGVLDFLASNKLDRGGVLFAVGGG